jgi:hypothetical protein
LTGQDFYDPGDWERVQSGEEFIDEQGWTGGEFVLGGLGVDEAGRSAGNGSGSSAATGSLSRREILARAAEERMQKESPKEKQDDA